MSGFTDERATPPGIHSIPVNPLEYNLSDQWFVRVLGKEYGPVDAETLQEWKAEGRLIHDNEVRRASESEWTKAGNVEELFASPPALPTEAETSSRRRTLSEIIFDSCRIYRRGFATFFTLALLVCVPSFLMKVSMAFVQIRPETGFGATPPVAIAVTLLLLPVVVAAWLAFIGGLQFATADIAAGRAPELRNVLRRVREIWTRVAKVGAVVYGSYIFWTALPLFAILTIVGGQPSVASIFIALAALALQVYMAGRLFINFLFWQQTCTIGELDGPDALRESRDLARSQSTAPRLQRPLYRGAIIASLWLLVLLACSAAVELPFLMLRLRGVTTIEEVRPLMEQLVNAPAPDLITITTYALSGLLHAFLRPLLGIAFVLLYFDARARTRD